jgi:hypothetical protein
MFRMKKCRPGRGSEGKRAASLNPGGVPKANRNRDSKGKIMK